MKNKNSEKKNIVIGVIGCDCHSVGNKILERFFSATGDFNVVNLGVMVNQDEFIDAALETGSAAILISSLYGHGEIDCAGFRGRCTERGLEDIILYVGGNLMIGNVPRTEIESKFKEIGFDRVFSPGCDLTEVASLLKKDISELKARHR